jgi:hypothetical protein
MKSLNFILIITFFSVTGFAQIWDYPPEPVSNWVENSNVPKDSLKNLTVWTHKIVDGIDSGEKELKTFQEFDSSGNTVKIIYWNGDSVLYGNYINGFWQVKIMMDRIINQTVEFDENQNVVSLSHNDFHHTVKYDSLNRPVSAVNNVERFYWIYSDSLLSSYEVYKNGLLSEIRTYHHDSKENTVAYTSQYYDTEGMPYQYPDSVKGYFNDQNEVYKLVSVSHDSYGWDTMEITLDKVNHTLYKVQSNNCIKYQSLKDDRGYTYAILEINNEGVIRKKTSFEYEFE